MCHPAKLAADDGRSSPVCACPPPPGRKPLTAGDPDDPDLARTLERLAEPATRDDPMSPLRWTCKSKENLAQALRDDGYPVSASTVGRLLHDMGYSLQSVRKNREGASHSDRNAQFEHIADTVRLFPKHDQPVISIDTKKKELVGDFKNGGCEWQREHLRLSRFTTFETMPSLFPVAPGQLSHPLGCRDELRRQNRALTTG